MNKRRRVTPSVPGGLISYCADWRREPTPINTSPLCRLTHSGVMAKASTRRRPQFCDCATYALAKAMNAPLPFKGDDFAGIDVRTCL